MKFGDRQAVSCSIGSTGGWSRWISIDTPDTFELAEGETVLRIEWSGTASSLVNLNWMDFTYHPELNSIGTPRPVQHTRYATISIANGILSLHSHEDITKIELFSLDGRILRTILPFSRRYSMPIGKGIFLLTLQNRQGTLNSQRIVHF